GGNNSTEYKHILDSMVHLEFESGLRSTGFCVGQRDIFVYAHGVGEGSMMFEHRSVAYEIPEDMYEVEQFVTGQGKMDMARIVIDSSIGLEFKGMWKHIAKPIFSRDALLITKMDNLFREREAGTVKDAGMIVMKDFDGNIQGMRMNEISYYALTVRGDCGSLLLQKQYGTWKIIAMHNGSRQGLAYGVRLDVCIAKYE
nr:3C proteinase [limnipivirus A1]